MADCGDAFEQFHSDNPHVYDTLVRLCREWVTKTGRRKLGIDSLFGAARWKVMISTNDPDYRLRNDYKPYYSRLVMVQERDLAGLFDTKEAEFPDRWINGWIDRMPLDQKWWLS